MESSTVSAINAKFDERLKRMDRFNQKRPVNSFAIVAPSNNVGFKPEYSSVSKIGAVYVQPNSVEYVVENKADDSVLLDTYSVNRNPKAGHIKFTPQRLTVENTREK